MLLKTSKRHHPGDNNKKKVKTVHLSNFFNCAHVFVFYATEALLPLYTSPPSEQDAPLIARGSDGISRFSS